MIRFLNLCKGGSGIQGKVTVVVNGEEAVSITIQSMNGRGGGRGKQNQGTY